MMHTNAKRKISDRKRDVIVGTKKWRKKKDNGSRWRGEIRDVVIRGR